MKPGDRFAIVRDGETRVGTINGWSYRSGSPAIYAELTWWQRVLRRLTPPSWRRPIPVVREATLDRVELNFGEFEPLDPDVMARCQKNIAAVHAMAEAMADLPPGSSILDVGTGKVTHTPGHWARRFAGQEAAKGLQGFMETPNDV